MVGGLFAIAAGLIHLGIPKEDAIKYESAIIADKFLLNCKRHARGTRVGAPHPRDSFRLLTDALGSEDHRRQEWAPGDRDGW